MTAERQRRLKDQHRVRRHLFKTGAPENILDHCDAVLWFMESDWRKKHKCPKLNHVKD